MNLFNLSAVLTLDTHQYEQGIASARQTAQGFTKSTDDINGALGKAQKGFTVFKGVLSNVATQGVGMLANAISSNLGGAISRVDTINNYSTVMKNLGHGAKESQKAIDELVEGIDGLPTTLDGIVTVQQQFAALGGKMEDATALTIALNNATLAGGQGQAKANGAMQQWYQMIAAGKSDMMSMRIINEAMPAQMDAIAKAVMGADANWQDLHEEWQKNPEITQKVKDAILELNEEGINGTAGFAKQAEDATKGIQTSMQNLQTAIKNGIAGIIQEIGTDNIAKMFSGLKDGVKLAFGEITDFIKDAKELGLGEAISVQIENAKERVWGAFTNLMAIDWSSLFGTALQTMGDVFPQVFEIALGIDTLKTNITENLLQVGAEVVMGFIDGIISEGPNLVAVGIETLTNYASGIIDNMTRLANTAARVINKFVDYLSKNSDKVVNGAGKIVVAIGKGIVKNAPKILASMAKLGAAIINGLVKIVPKIPAIAFKIIAALAGALASGAGKVLSAAKNLATGAINAIRSGFAAVGDVGMNLVRGIWSGISSGYGWITGQIRSWVGNVKSFIKNLFGINSPSKWARDVIGKGIDEGMALGILQNTGLVDDALEATMPDVSTMNLMSEHAPTGNRTSFSYPVFNNEFVVNGADNPEATAEVIMNKLQLVARLA